MNFVHPWGHGANLSLNGLILLLFDGQAIREISIVNKLLSA